ncbi:MAG: asparagine--tRNA ligase [Bacteriovoracaceae bacterium]|nr:asparagine--tRNA ligase [Bacteriovoracaceae bacterium]
MSRRFQLKEIFSKEIKDTEGCVKGWVKSVRTAKWGAFVVINDGSAQKDLQCVVDATLANFETTVKQLTIGCSVSVTGKLVESQGKVKSIEMQTTQIELIGNVMEDYPLQKKATSLEFLREVAHLRSRTNTFGAVFRIRHHLAFATHKFFHDRGFFYLHTPIITSSDCEGAGEMFRVSTLDLKNPPLNDKKQIDFTKDYFARETFLNVSGQLEAETYALGMGAVYTFGPTFRSENSNTARHLSEFWMVEPEVAFNDLDDNAQLATDYLKYLISYAMEHCPEEMAFLHGNYSPDLGKTLMHVLESPFEKITYTNAVEIIKKSNKKFEYGTVEWGKDLQTEHERFLAEEHFKRPVIVTDYPKAIKAFYMKQGQDGKTVRAMDVLVPGVGEIIGGSQREDDLEKLKTRMKEMHLPEENYWWYLDLRRFGSVPHAGFGLGFERAVMYITGMTNIRDVIAFPRFPRNAEF